MKMKDSNGSRGHIVCESVPTTLVLPVRFLQCNSLSNKQSVIVQLFCSCSIHVQTSNPSGTCELLCSVDQDVDPGSLGSSALRLLNESDLESNGRMETVIFMIFYIHMTYLDVNYCDCGTWYPSQVQVLLQVIVYDPSYHI